MLKFLLQLDGSILLWIQEYIRIPALNSFMAAFTHVGDAGIIWILLTLALLIPKKTRAAGIQSAIALLLSLLINNILLKNLVARTRPYDVVEGLVLLTSRAIDYSFPSGHAGAGFASALTMFHTLPRRWGTAALVLAGLIALSRLYVGIHYPSDVIAGTLTGILCGMAALRIWQRRGSRTEKESQKQGPA